MSPCGYLLRSIGCFCRCNSSSSRLRLLDGQLSRCRITPLRFKYIPKFYSVDAAATTLREMENASISKDEVSNIAETLERFERISKSNDFDHITLNPVVQDCIRALPSMNRGEYVQLISTLLIVKEKFCDLYDWDHNMIRISEHLDNILRGWFYQLEREEDVLDVLRMSKALAGHRDLTVDIIKGVKKALRWSTPSMLQYVQHMNANRLWNIYYVDKYNVEYAFSQHLPHLDINRAAIMLRALSELKASINTPDLPRRVFQLFLEQHSSATLSTLTVFAKFFSRLVHSFWDSSSYVHALLPNIVRVLNQHVDSWPLSTIVYFASFCRRIICYDQVFFEKLAQRMSSDDVLHLRPDVIDELIMAIVYFNGQGRYTEDLVRFVELLKVEPLHSCLIRTHPKRLVSIMNNLSKVGVYDSYFLEVILSNGFLVDAYKKLNAHYVSVNVYSLDHNVEAEYTNYDGRRLDEKLRQLFEKKWYAKVSKFLALEHPDDVNYFRYCRQASAHERLVREMKSVLVELLSEKCLHLCQMHLHIPRMNFIFALKDGVPQKLDQRIKESHHFRPTLLDREYDWYTFEFLTPNTLPPHEPLLLYNGINSARLLRQMGMNFIPLVGKNWRSLAKPEKIESLRNLIYNRKL